MEKILSNESKTPFAEVTAMLKFIYDAKDSEGVEFQHSLVHPTQPNEDPMHWKVAPGKFGFVIGKAFVLDGPEEGARLCPLRGKGRENRVYDGPSLGQV